MDYLQEGRTAEEVNANLSAADELAGTFDIPDIYWEYTTERVLTLRHATGDTPPIAPEGCQACYAPIPPTHMGVAGCRRRHTHHTR